MNTVIKTHRLTKSFGHDTALYPIDFTLLRGEICALIGRNGAGKSTFFKLLSGQLLPAEGELQLFGSPYKQCGNERKKVGFMIESPVFFDDFTAKKNLEYFRLQRGIADKKHINDTMKIVGLDEHKHKKFKEYSMGMKQRLGLALSLLSGPDLLVLDEPINGLDAQGIAEIRNLLLKLNKEKQITLLISSHILSELQLMADRFVFIEKGKIVEDMTKEELLKKSGKHIMIKVDNVSKTVTILEEHLPDIQLRVLHDQTISIDNHIDDSTSINQLLFNHDIVVREFKVETNNLEDYFLNIQGGVQHD